MNNTVSQPVRVLVGLTHASRVIPVVRSNEFESGILTKSLTPSNFNALPYLPVVTQTGPLLNVPVFEFPDRSKSVVPDPSSKPYAATKPALADETRINDCELKNKFTSILNCNTTTTGKKYFLSMAQYSNFKQTIQDVIYNISAG